MHRRDFLKRGVSKVAEAALDRVSLSFSRPPAVGWVRPPFALPEEQFLDTCTGCGECVRQCPTQAIFMIPEQVHSRVTGTAALDVIEHACLLCVDYPCVQSCEPKALLRSETAFPEKLSNAQIDETRCLPYQGPECGACADSCPVPGALLWQGSRPYIDAEKCLGCGACRAVCIAYPNAITMSLLDKNPA
jgi:ferredoxin-type protein NapG